MHKACYNAVHSLQRMTSKDPVLKNHVDQLMMHDPQQFKQLAMHMIALDKGARTAKIRERARNYVVELATQQMLSRSESVVLLTRNQFIAHMI